MKSDNSPLYVFGCFFLYVCDADERVREGFGQAGLAGEQTFAPGFYGTF